jgi:hypothetical protein
MSLAMTIFGGNAPHVLPMVGLFRRIGARNVNTRAPPHGGAVSSLAQDEAKRSPG